MKVEARSPALDILDPNRTSMSLDIRADNSEAHSKAVVFRGKKLFEEALAR